ncbi:hypothetical protein S40288_09637 [Stachybotrys chartarum IBT 40288]|nr:hypothetical protein S40288_09637 [Stachybotrys chartarum IBT 40288]
MPAMSQCPHSVKRFKSAGGNDLLTSPIPAGKIATHTLLAPMAQMDSPTAGPENSVADVSVATEEDVTPRTPSPTLLGTIGSKIVGAFTEGGPLGLASPNRIPVASRKRSIDEVEDAMTVRQYTQTFVPENEGPAGQKRTNNDTAMKLNTQLKDPPKAADLRTGEAAPNSPTIRGRSMSPRNGTSFVPAKISTRAKHVLTPARKAIKIAEAKSSSLSRLQRARKSDVAEAALGSKSVAAEAESADTSNNLNQFEIDKIVGHRHNADDPTLLDVRVSWKSDDPAGDFTWETEANVQEDAPDALFRYWRTFKGGRSSVLKDPDMWHVFRVEKHRIIQGTNDVMLQVAWVGSTQRSWEPEAAVAGYAKEHLDEYWAKLGGRESILTTAALQLPTTHTKPQKEMARKRTKSGMSKAAETGALCNTFTAYVFWNPTSRKLEGAAHLPQGMDVPDVNTFLSELFMGVGTKSQQTRRRNPRKNRLHGARKGAEESTIKIAERDATAKTGT